MVRAVETQLQSILLPTVLHPGLGIVGPMGYIGKPGISVRGRLDSSGDHWNHNSRNKESL